MLPGRPSTRAMFFRGTKSCGLLGGGSGWQGLDIGKHYGVTRGLTAGADPAVTIKSTHPRAFDRLSWCRWRARRLPSLVTAWCPVPSATGFGSARTRAAHRRDCPSPRVTASVPDRLFRDRARPGESPRRAESQRWFTIGGR